MGAKAANDEHRHAMQTVWAVLAKRNIIKTDKTPVNIVGSGKMASPLEHTKWHVRNVKIALDNAKEASRTSAR